MKLANSILDFFNIREIALFNPAGPVALEERDLILKMLLIMAIVIVPLLITLFLFAWKYRAGNKNAVERDLEKPHNPWSELALWVVPVVIVAALWVLTWNSAHALDPYQSIQSANPPITIEVVALPWKWLFIYPAQNIATVNFIEFPVNTPVHFELTADAPMSSFWIPQLGSQIYAMAAMETQLNLMATETGDFTGKDTEINGEGYAGMQFVARSALQGDFNNWVASVQAGSSTLDQNAYDELSEPSENNPPAQYASVEAGLFGNIMMKYMMPMGTSTVKATSSVEQNASQAMPAMMPGMQM